MVDFYEKSWVVPAQQLEEELKLQRELKKRELKKNQWDYPSFMSAEGLTHLTSVYVGLQRIHSASIPMPSRDTARNRPTRLEVTHNK